jgi:hypothetical protein
MDFNRFEQHANTEFAKHAPRVLNDGEDLQEIINDIFPALETLAITEQIEFCERSAWMLVMGLFDSYLMRNAEQLGVPDEYFHNADAFATVYARFRHRGWPAAHLCEAA